MKPVRQLYAAEMLVASNNYSTRFARGLLAVTKPDGLVDPNQAYKRPHRTTANQQSVMEQGSDALLGDIKMVQKGYTGDLLSLTIAAGYITRMLENARVERHLLKHHPDILQAIREILDAVNEEKARNSSDKQFPDGDTKSPSFVTSVDGALSLQESSVASPPTDVLAPSAASGDSA
jgi:hypothetical protein